MRDIAAATPLRRLGLPVAVILTAVLALLASACSSRTALRDPPVNGCLSGGSNTDDRRT
jgi:hypothetical protein